MVEPTGSFAEALSAAQAQFTCTCRFQKRKGFQNTCSEPQETDWYSMSPCLVVSHYSQVGGIYSDSPAYKFKCLFPSSLRFAMISERSRKKMPCGPYLRLVEVAEATQSWKRRNEDEFFSPNPFQQT